MWRLTLIGAALIVAATPGLARDAQVRTGDAALVRALLDEYAASWQAGDAARMYATAGPDIH